VFFICIGEDWWFLMNFILMAEIYECKFLYICSVPEGRDWFLILRM